MKILNTLSFIVLSLVCVWATPTFAQPPNKSGVPDSQEFSPGRDVANLFDTAFTNKFWNFDAGLNSQGGFERLITDEYTKGFEAKHLKERYSATPWLMRYVLHTRGWPNSDVLHKWNSEVSFGIGWPPRSNKSDGSTLEPIGDLGFYEQPGTAQFHDLISSQIIRTIPRLESVFRNGIRYIPPEEESQENYAKVRIIPMNEWPQRSPYRGSGYNIWKPYEDEEDFWGAIPFENSGIGIMDSYMFAEPSNEIGLVVCKVNIQNSEFVLRRLISECMVRAMGLPGTLRSEPRSTLGNWHSDKLPGEAADADADHEMTSTLPDQNDLRLIRILYCEALKSGMTKSQVFSALVYESKNCLNAKEG